MADSTTPVKKSDKDTVQEDTPGAENAVHFYRRDIDAKPRPAGSFLGAFIHHSGAPGFFCQSYDAADYDDFVSRVAKGDAKGRPCRYVAPGDAKGFQDAPVLRLSEGDMAPLMWRRRTLGQRRYSIVGGIADLGSGDAQAALTGLLNAPAQPWDALVYPSNTIKTAAERLIAIQAEYLTFRMGAQAHMDAMSFVIPPGINAGAYQASDESTKMREGVRRRLGIRDDDFCVLATGNFQFYGRVHPTPLYLALESAARRTGVRIHLLQAGWFDNERIERAYRDAVRDFAPAVNAIFLDGRERDIRDRVWFAADAYAAFHDAVTHGADTEIFEAMAAGLPVVAADWGGNRDTLKSGEHGYLVPTWLPLAESGGDLTLAPENPLGGTEPGRADALLAGTVGQTTSLDLRAAAEAFEALAGDVAHRRQLGEAARARALAKFDWPVVIQRHQKLWGELRRIRSEAPEVAPPIPGRPAIPHMDDPYSVFRAYATHAIDEHVKVRLAGGIKSGEGLQARLARLRANAINDIAQAQMLEPKEQEHVLAHLSESDAAEVIQIAELLPERRRYLLPRTLGWLAKMGMVRLALSDAQGTLPTGASDMTNAGEGRGRVSLAELGAAARRHGADDSAVEYLETALRENPKDAAAHVQLGEIMADANDLEGAVKHFAQAVDGNPTAVDARLDLGKAKVLQGDHQGGIAALQEAVELAPENAEAHYLLGAAYRRAGATSEALQSLEKSARLSPRRIETLVHLGLARKSAGRRAEALQAFRDALKLAPHNLFARAGEMSLGAERDGKKLTEREPSTSRVALHFNAASHFQPLADLFHRLDGVHWPLLTADGQDLAEFQPDVVIVAGLQVRDVRALATNAVIIVAPAFLSSQNRFRQAFDGADVACAPGDTMAEAWATLGLMDADRIRAIGHIPLDPLFRGDQIAVPKALQSAGSTVLYAPGHRPKLSSAMMLGDDPVHTLRGTRDDVTLVIKPHPETFRRRPQWIEKWARAAASHDRVVLVDDPDADVLPYLRAADVLVSDVSSVMFDFVAVDRPILLLRNPEYTADEAGYDAQGIEWRWREAGREILNPDDLARAVDLALKTPDAGTEVRERVRNALFGWTADGRAAERMVALITELST